MRRSNNGQTPNTPKVIPARAPKAPYLNAVHKLSERVPELLSSFDGKGYLRTLLTESDAGLFPNAVFQNARTHAQAFLKQPEVYNGLGLRYVELSEPETVELPLLGYRVSYQQQVNFEGKKVPVLHGLVSIRIGHDGVVHKLDSTLRHGSRALQVDSASFKARTEADAVAVAHAKLRFAVVESVKTEFVFSEHNRHMDPIWRVVVSGQPHPDKPRSVMEVMVKATTGRVVGKPRETLKFIRPKRGFRQPLAKLAEPKSVQEAVMQAFTTDAGDIIRLSNARRRRPKGKSPRTGNTQVAGKGLLFVPDTNKDIIKQVYDIVIESLPDPKVLVNDNFDVYIGNQRDPVKAKSDGTFNYLPNDAQFSAVVTFFVLNIQWELMKLWGLPKGTKRIPVRVEDRTTMDNATFDPENWEIRIGQGSSVRLGGLTRYIAYDIGVALHENGHHLVYELAPGKDLPGDEGGAIHEAVGDVQGSILICWWLKAKLSNVLGVTVTVKDVEDDERRMGLYAMPPNGIRHLKNQAKPPISGEVHDDALIVGGAMSDLLVAMVKKHGVEPGLELFGKLTNGALQSVPANKVTFKDLLTAYRSVDAQLNKKDNHTEITDCFADHGIKLGKSKHGTPVIVLD